MQDPLGEGRHPGLGAAIGILSHAVLIAVLVTFGGIAATLAAIFLAFVVVRSPGPSRRRVVVRESPSFPFRPMKGVQPPNKP